jgi:hypothetical protein
MFPLSVASKHGDETFYSRTDMKYERDNGLDAQEPADFSGGLNDAGYGTKTNCRKAHPRKTAVRDFSLP